MGDTLFRGRAQILVIALVGLYVITLAVLQSDDPAAQGRAGSSFSTSAQGTVAFRELVAQNGHDVEQRRTPLGVRPPDPASTVVIVDGGSPFDRDVDALAEFLLLGGRLVAVETAIDGLVDSPPGPPFIGNGTGTASLPHDSVAGVTQIVIPNRLVWASAGSLLPVVPDQNSTVVGLATPGRGTLIAASDGSIFANEALDEGDNAALALAVVGPADRDVVFVEYVHGFTDASGLLGLPPRWQWVVVGLLVSAAMFLLAKGRRLGPPESPQRALPPPRVQNVEALAAALARTKDPAGAAAPLQLRARRALRRRGIDPNAGDGRSGVAARAGVRTADIKLVAEGVASNNDLLALAKIVAALESDHPTGKGP